MIRSDDNRRPISVTLLALTVLILTVFNTVRFGSAMVQWELILDFMPRPGPIYIAVTGLIWALAWLTVFIGLWLGTRWARLLTLSISTLYSTYDWMDRLIYQSKVAQVNLSFSLGATVLFLVSIAVIMFLPGSRKYFKAKRVQ